MNEYEVFIEDVNSCGGEQYAKKEIIEVEADNPEAYVKENGRFPIIDISKNANGDTVIITLPGSKKASAENILAVIDPVAHGLDMLYSEGSADCAK